MSGPFRPLAGPASLEIQPVSDSASANIAQTEADLLGRFEEREPLGQGATGTVVRAFDRVRRHDVALKVLHTFDPDSLFRFKQEFRALAGLVHPNVVTLYALTLVDDRWVVAMELVEEARPFLDYVRPYRHHLYPPSGLASGSDPRSLLSESSIPLAGASIVNDETRVVDSDPLLDPTVDLPKDDSSGPGAGASVSSSGSMSRRMAIITAALDLERLYDALRQLIDALDAVHQCGILHRDIKPSNVLVDRTGRVVVCDFGLVMSALDAGGGDLVGTPAYMSPEQAARGALTTASDYYSVGVMLYEALTGQLPVDSDSLSTLLASKRDAQLVPPRQLEPQIPVALESLCLALLDVRPDQRPNAAEIRAVLDTLPSPSLRRAEPSEREEIPFVGRERERASLRQAFLDARAGQTVAVMISGPSGVGKTALATTLCEELRDQHGALLLRGRCYRAESVPFKAVDAVVDALATHLMELPVEQAERLVPPPAPLAALCEMFPVLRRAAAVARVVEPPRMSSPAVELRPVARVALGSLVGALARRRPVVILIDDLQWGDLDSEPLLREIIQEPGSPGALVLVTYRDEADRSAPPLVEAVARPPLGGLGVHHDVRRLTLEPLGVDETEALIGAVIGPEHDLPRKAVDRTAAAAAGHPMFVIELAHALRAQKSVVSSQSLDDLIEVRIEGLPYEARLLLEATATTAWPQPLSLLSSALGLTQEASTLAQLLAERMVRIVPGNQGERITPYHDRIRETTVARLSDKSLQRLHRKLARAFERAPEPDFEALAHHWAGAEEPRRAAHYALRAGERALANRAYLRAAEHLSPGLVLGAARRRHAQRRPASLRFEPCPLPVAFVRRPRPTARSPSASARGRPRSCGAMPWSACSGWARCTSPSP